MKSKTPARGTAATFMSHSPDMTPTRSDVDYIEVAGQAEFELHSSNVTLTLTVVSETLQAGPSAMQEVAELGTLRQSLLAAGARQITLLAFDGQAKSGLLGTHTEARYTVQAKSPTSALAAVLVSIAKNKNVTLVASSWEFPDAEVAQQEATTAATQQAHKEALLVADALAVPLKTPHRVFVSRWAEEAERSPVRRTTKSASSADLYVRLGSVRTVYTKVVLRFRV